MIFATYQIMRAKGESWTGTSQRGLGLLKPATYYQDVQVRIWWNMISPWLLAAAAEGTKVYIFSKRPNLPLDGFAPAL